MLCAATFARSILISDYGFRDDLICQQLDIFAALKQYSSNDPQAATRVKFLDENTIAGLSNQDEQYACLLLNRHVLTERLSAAGVLYPPLILDRARTYEALGYADLATADAWVTFTLCETVTSDEWVSDLEPREPSGESWPKSGEPKDALAIGVEALAILYRSLLELGTAQDAGTKYTELLERMGRLYDSETPDEVRSRIATLILPKFRLFPMLDYNNITSGSNFGMSRREIYPWNEHEPDRNAPASIQEINSLLKDVAPELEAKVTALPALDGKDTWYQLGLFAAKDLAPSATILEEKSILTALRPLDDALCDACGADLETTDREEMQECPGDECDTTFCSEQCAIRAANEYHKPTIVSEEHDDEDGGEEEEDKQSDYPPSTSPFCGNTALQEIGRTSSTTTPEWDLYFLLLTRTIQMSTTQSIHPLDLPSIKYLWGDFTTTPTAPPFKPNPTTVKKKTLPFSLYHNILLPLQFFETLMHSLPATHQPYASTHWLTHYDFWVVQTLFAKFRGVANAQQSTFDGKPEIAAVHPLWCLANHSCDPNVKWTPTGVRKFVVVEDKLWNRDDGNKNGNEKQKWTGIKRGEEIWSHYTDVRLSVGERRERLKEVLGGKCRCVRCLTEE